MTFLLTYKYLVIEYVVPKGGDSMVKTFYSDKTNGVMSGQKKFYSESLTKEAIIKDLKERREKLGELIGFDGTKILVPATPAQKPFISKDVTEEITELLHQDPNYDLWNLDIKCDVMLIRSSLKGVVLAYPVADCPLVVVSARDTLGIAHCSSKMIDGELPISLVDAVSKVSGAKDSELRAYIGPCAGYSYVYETYPEWATNDDWKYFIDDLAEGYRINLKGAIISQLMRRGVKGVTTSTVADTITDPRFYSNYGYVHGDESKNGRFLTGAYFEKVKTR